MSTASLSRWARADRGLGAQTLVRASGQVWAGRGRSRLGCSSGSGGRQSSRAEVTAVGSGADRWDSEPEVVSEAAREQTELCVVEKGTPDMQLESLPPDPAPDHFHLCDLGTNFSEP